MSGGKVKTDTGHAAFFLGVIGDESMEEHSQSQEVASWQQRIRRLFRFLRHGPKFIEKGSFPARPILERIVSDLVPPDADDELRQAYREALDEWPGLGMTTPIVLITNLARGADTIVARIAQEREFVAANFRLQIPLPFPPDMYVRSAMFDDPSEPVRSQARQVEFLEILERVAVQRQIAGRQRPNLSGMVGDNDAVKTAFELANISPWDMFVAALDEDAKYRQEQRNTKIRKDFCESDQKPDKHYLRRCDAANEFVAVASHLMIAIWDGQPQKDCRVAKTVKARLQGPEPGVLPTTSYLQMPHGGPVWHLVTGQSNKKPSLMTDETVLPNTRILHPSLKSIVDGGQSKYVAQEQLTDVSLQADRLLMFARIGANLTRFNNEFPRYCRDNDQQTSKVFSHKVRSVLAKWPSTHQHAIRQLNSLIVTRTGADGLGDHLQQRYNRLVASLFLLTFVGISLLQVSDAAWLDTATGLPVRMISGVTWPQFCLFGTSVIVFLGAILYFCWQRFHRIEQRGHDSRAIAEGLRVQFFWNLAGVGDSVSANYMTRHRSELDWVAAVIRSTSLPYRQWTYEFEKLPSKVQIRTLQIVHEGWVRDQLNYFTGACTKKHHIKCVWQEFGGAAALAGIFIYIHTYFRAAKVPIGTSEQWLLGAIIVLAGAAAVSFSLALARIRDRRVSPTPMIDVHKDLWDRFFDALIAFTTHPPNYLSSVSKRVKRDWLKTIKIRNPKRIHSQRALQYLGQFLEYVVKVISRIFWLFFEVIDALVPSLRNPPAQRTKRLTRVFRGALSFTLYVPLSVAFASLAHFLSEWIYHIAPYSPSVHDLCLLIGAILLLAGTLSIAWAEKNFFSELSYQYNTMATLFHTAYVRLGQRLEKLESEEKKGQEHSDYQKELKRIQKLLNRLGRDALEENAEWLLLHRARPLEPLMPS